MILNSPHPAAFDWNRKRNNANAPPPTRIDYFSRLWLRGVMVQLRSVFIPVDSSRPAKCRAVVNAILHVDRMPMSFTLLRHSGGGRAPANAHCSFNLASFFLSSTVGFPYTKVLPFFLGTCNLVVVTCCWLAGLGWAVVYLVAPYYTVRAHQQLLSCFGGQS